MQTMRLARVRAALAALALIPLSQSCAAQTEVTVKGMVVDSAGATVAGVSVAENWVWSGDQLAPMGGTISAADGSFALPLHLYRGGVEVMVLDSAGQRGGFGSWKSDALGEAARLTLAPLVTLRAQLTPPEGSQPECFGQLRHKGEGTSGLQWSGSPGVIAFALPAGDYELFVGGTDLRFKFLRATLVVDKPETDLGSIQLEPTVLSQYAGKPPLELHVTDARGVPADIKLSDYKGKWVLVEFWGFW